MAVVKLIPYLRVSSDRQADDGTGLDVLNDAIRGGEKANGYKLTSRIGRKASAERKSWTIDRPCSTPWRRSGHTRRLASSSTGSTHSHENSCSKNSYSGTFVGWALTFSAPRPPSPATSLTIRPTRHVASSVK